MATTYTETTHIVGADVGTHRQLERAIKAYSVAFSVDETGTNEGTAIAFAGGWNGIGASLVTSATATASGDIVEMFLQIKLNGAWYNAARAADILGDAAAVMHTTCNVERFQASDGSALLGALAEKTAAAGFPAFAGTHARIYLNCTEAGTLVTVGTATLYFY